MDPGSDPGRDDYGLPPVDIEVPDDARDLDRDVQAYYRELKALRRRSRTRRVMRPLVHRGLLVPIIAACLALGLVGGTLFTIRGGGTSPITPPSQAPSGTSQRPASPDDGSGELPDAQVELAGRVVTLRSLVPAVLAWVPLSCACGATLTRLVRQAAQAHINVYYVGTSKVVTQLRGLAGQSTPVQPQVVDDTSNALGAQYHLSKLTAILAHSDGSVRAGDVLSLPADTQLAQRLPSLADPAPATTAPGSTATISAASPSASS